MLQYEGVTFVVGSVKAMTRDKFISMHINVYWKDRTEKQRRKMLSDVYYKITGISSEEVTE